MSYVDEDIMECYPSIFKPDMYIYIRKEKYKWGDESNNTTDKKIDFDSVLIFKIERIESEWKKEKKELNKDDTNTHIHLDTINNLLSIYLSVAFLQAQKSNQKRAPPKPTSSPYHAQPFQQRVNMSCGSHFCWRVFAIGDRIKW